MHSTFYGQPSSPFMSSRFIADTSLHRTNTIYFGNSQSRPLLKKFLTQAIGAADKSLDTLTSRPANCLALLIQVFGGFGGSVLFNHIDSYRNPPTLNVPPYCVLARPNTERKLMVEPLAIDEAGIIKCPTRSKPGKFSLKTIPNSNFGQGGWDVPSGVYEFSKQAKEFCGASGGGPLTAIVFLDLTKQKIRRRLTNWKSSLEAS